MPNNLNLQKNLGVCGFYGYPLVENDWCKKVEEEFGSQEATGIVKQ